MGRGTLPVDLSDDGEGPVGRRPAPRPVPHDPTEPEIEATRERLCLDRLLAAEGPAATRARIVDRLRLRAKIERLPRDL